MPDGRRHPGSGVTRPRSRGAPRRRSAGGIRARQVLPREVVERTSNSLRARSRGRDAIAVERFEAARAEADAADARIAAAAAEDDLPPLLGVPCTIKEIFVPTLTPFSPVKSRFGGSD